MTKLQEIVKKAKALKKAYPKKYSKWTDYVKAASKLVPKSKTVGAVKKTATKKTGTRSTHKDTRSHNVNVKVVSGVSLYGATKAIQNKAENQLKDIKIINSMKTKLLSTTNGTKANLELKSKIKKITQKYYEKYGVDVRPTNY